MRTIPKLFLRWVSPSEVYDDYQKGLYSKIKVEDAKLKVTIKEITREIYEGAGPEQDRFNFKTREGSEIVVVTDNSVLYNFLNSREPGKTLTIRCTWCRCDFEVSDTTKPVLIPLEKEETELVTQFGRVRQKIYKGDWPHCDFNCALSTCLSRRDIPAASQTYLLNVHARCYPGTILKPAGDPGMIDVNGGCISHKEYKKERNETFREITGVIQLPVKRAFVRI